MLLADIKRLAEIKEFYLKNIGVHLTTDNSHWSGELTNAIQKVSGMFQCGNQSLTIIKLSLFLTGTIIVDTINMLPKAGKTTPVDEAIVAKLESALGDIDRDKLFKEIQAEKFNLSGKNTPHNFSVVLHSATALFYYKTV